MLIDTGMTCSRTTDAIILTVFTTTGTPVSITPVTITKSAYTTGNYTIYNIHITVHCSYDNLIDDLFLLI